MNKIEYKILTCDTLKMQKLSKHVYTNKSSGCVQSSFLGAAIKAYCLASFSSELINSVYPSIVRGIVLLKLYTSFLVVDKLYFESQKCL